MADVTTNALRGLVKTLSDVVVPAIPADDPLALQELKMVVRYLSFARERVDHLYARARYELAFYSDLVAQLAEILGSSHGSEAKRLSDLRAGAAALLAEPGAPIDDLRSLNLEITSSISNLLGEVRDVEVLPRLERAVVRASAEITAFDRSWYAPLKLERFPQQVRPLSSFIPMPKTVS
jgi:hypothetical protein